MSGLKKTGGTMNCGVVSELLEAYHGGQLNARAEESVRQHLDTCAACTVRLGALQRKSGNAESVASEGSGGTVHSSGGKAEDAGARTRWWSGIPKLALVPIVLAMVIVPGSIWMLSARLADSGQDSGDGTRLPAVVALREMGDNESRTAGFTLTRPVDLRVYALGEGQNGQMFDFGLIADAATHRPVWTMEYSETDHAGGGDKNRKVDQVVSLDAGSYLVHYRSDGSHSHEEWNVTPPDDGGAWGITVSLVEAADRQAVESYDPSDLRTAAGRAQMAATDRVADARRVAEVARARARAAVEARNARPTGQLIARLVRMGDDEDAQRTFTLDGDALVRVYALGESTSGDMHDYAWIEEASTGSTVWRMTAGNTEHAGGAEKNRLVNETLRLSAGEYVLRYRSDDSHSADGWNAAAPDDAENYGVIIIREGR